MKVAFGFCISEDIKEQTHDSKFVLDLKDDKLIAVPVQIWEGEIEKLRKKLHEAVDCLVDRSCIQSTLDMTKF